MSYLVTNHERGKREAKLTTADDDVSGGDCEVLPLWTPVSVAFLVSIGFWNCSDCVYACSHINWSIGVT
jgi:hypothetical protein